MEENTTKSPKEEIQTEEESNATEQPLISPKASAGGGGWGGWGFSPLSVFTDLQKAATVAAEEISRNAVEAAKTAAKSIAEMQTMAEDSESSKEDETEASDKEGGNDDEEETRRKAALDKLEKASEDTLLGLASPGYEF